MAEEGRMDMRQSDAALPVIGLTCDVEVGSGKIFLRDAYVDAVVAAGGVPLLLAPSVGLVDDYLALCAGFIFTGGDDPLMEEFGEATHPKATPVARSRQEFEIALLAALGVARCKPVLGICLGMQMMALTRGGELAQYLPESLATHELHWGKKEHGIRGRIGEGNVLSHHKQAMVTAGAGFEVIGRSVEDDVIEAIEDSSWGPFCVGVQWHPEQSGAGDLGAGLLRRLVLAAAGLVSCGCSGVARSSNTGQEGSVD